MSRRAGSTLIEVLVAIFVMGIGLLAILAMFPLAALTMAESIKDDRMGHCAHNARAIAVLRNVAGDPQLDSYFDNPGAPTNFQDAPPEGPSWAVYCDPVGFNSYSVASGTKDWIAGAASAGGIARQSANFVQIPVAPATMGQQMLKNCTLLDDITFGPDGKPSLSGGSVDRGASYSWAWLLRRPKAGIKAACSLTVVVYTNRSLGTGAGLAAREVAYRPNVVTTFDPKTPLRVSMTWTPGATVQPQIREGGWIFDMTPGLLVPPPPLPGGKWTPGNANFHRVVSVGDVLTAAGENSIALELATPIQWPDEWKTRTDTYKDGPLLVVMDGVAEVFDFGPSWKSAGN